MRRKPEGLSLGDERYIAEYLRVLRERVKDVHGVEKFENDVFTIDGTLFRYHYHRDEEIEIQWDATSGRVFGISPFLEPKTLRFIFWKCRESI